MYMPNFTLQDIFGVCLAYLIFPFVVLFPGYVIGWTVQLFDFRQRQIITRHLIALLVSVMVIPILFYLLAFFISFYVVKWAILSFFVLYVLIIVSEKGKTNNAGISWRSNRFLKLALFVAAGWAAFTVFALIELQWQNRLYNNLVSLDLGMRVSVTNAITRTGVPPVHPNYYPGRPVYLTSLYYFWYILCSIVDQFGGGFVDARMALIAGDVWCGLALMALIALYIKIRNRPTGESAWKMALVGISLLAISGLDIIPALSNMLATRLNDGSMWPPGDIEHWNDQITAWVGSLLWVPHHVAAMIACMTGFLIFQYYRNSPIRKSISVMIIASLAFASAVGLSTWVTITFSLFLAVWAFILLVQNRDRDLILLLISTGLLALLIASPFLFAILKGGTGAVGLPVTMEVRMFYPVTSYMTGLPTISKNIAYLALLPLNYLMELGFFLVVGLTWLRKYQQQEIPDNPFLVPEVILLGVVFLVCSFARSAIFTNDLGWRGWLPGQFILLIWAVDLYQKIPFFHRNALMKFHPDSSDAKIAKLLVSLWMIGLFTSAVDVTLLRIFPLLVDANVAGFPNRLSLDRQLGERTFNGRLTYEFIDNKMPADIIIQQNPLSNIDKLDLPSGLYGNRQFAISYNVPYNVPLSLLNAKTKAIAEIFLLANQNSWDKIDMLCRDYFIDILVISDQDALWESLPRLHQQRAALYENRYYAVVPCGNFVVQNDQP